MVRKIVTQHIHVGPGLLLVQRCPASMRPIVIDSRTRNVGLFRYWTLPNIPLFLLATPTLFVLFRSGAWGLQVFGRVEQASEKAGGNSRTSTIDIDWSINSIGYRLAITQLALAAMLVVGYHVQVITRLCSGCVVWYWWAAVMIAADRDLGGKWFVRWTVMYGLIQGVLFAGFLPPA